MIKKFKFYKGLLVEIIETLCSICLYFEAEGRRNHNPMAVHMRSHFDELKEYSAIMRGGQQKPKCPNKYNCGDCIRAEGHWKGIKFRGFRCRINAR